MQIWHVPFLFPSLTNSSAPFHQVTPTWTRLIWTTTISISHYLSTHCLKHPCSDYPVSPGIPIPPLHFLVAGCVNSASEESVRYSNRHFVNSHRYTHSNELQTQALVYFKILPADRFMGRFHPVIFILHSTTAPDYGKCCRCGSPISAQSYLCRHTTYDAGTPLKLIVKSKWLSFAHLAITTLFSDWKSTVYATKYTHVADF